MVRGNWSYGFNDIAIMRKFQAEIPYQIWLYFMYYQLKCFIYVIYMWS